MGDPTVKWIGAELHDVLGYSASTVATLSNCQASRSSGAAPSACAKMRYLPVIVSAQSSVSLGVG